MQDDLTDVTATPVPPYDDGDTRTQETGAHEPAPAHAPTPVHTPTKLQDTGEREDYELGPGARLGEYAIDRKIGQGGMGVVYSAIHPLIGKHAAIKILMKELCSDPISLERFIDEARVVNQIGHPNIVDIFAFGEMPDGRRYFVMEWLKGESLRARIARGPVSLEETAAIVVPLARALQAAHDKGVIHRDLKPDNVFLVDLGDDVPVVKLLDFGIAKLARTDHRVERTATGAIVGTPQYIAPEQAKGYAIDHRADTYALGGLLFELLVGRPPFQADNAMEMVAKHLMEAPVAPSSIDPRVPPELDDLVLRMLAKTPDGRPSLYEVSAVLRELVSPARGSQPAMRPSSDPAIRASTILPVLAERAPSTPAVVEPMRGPNKRLAHVMIGAGLLAVGAVVAAILLTSSEDRAAQPLETFVAQGALADAAVADPPAAPVDAAVIVPRVEARPAVEIQAPPPAPSRRTEPIVRPARGRLEVTILNRVPRTQVFVDGAPYDPGKQLTVGVHDLEVRSPQLDKPLRTTVEIVKGRVTPKRITLPARKPRPAPPPQQQPPTAEEGKELMLPGAAGGR